MQIETVVDLSDNIAALVLAILREDIATPEQAFAVITNSKYMLTDEDTEDMIKMMEQGMKLEEISKIYGMTKSGVIARVRRYKKRTNSDCHLKRSTN